MPTPCCSAIAGLTARIVSVADFGPDVPVRRPEDTGAPISDRARKSVVTLEVTATRDVPLGRQVLRLRTPSARPRRSRSGWAISRRRASSNRTIALAQADTVTAPVTVNGVIFTDGDVDTFRFHRARGPPGRPAALARWALALASIRH